ncbi:hypothetical protein [Pseudomonas sp. N040]|uniref:hypothetical protein n=1 Tax=Pseudomonas sp. N040 TaxID=2785325 RepID=UPI0018A3218A|nr:hypothetical protein [Pseudomonas sp. N040]MBF7729780.1 hypothetical protein [Pseudomonas sp. N040]MBW7013422.1 GPI inositol-deacylase [Pseudomonas sp. N040]
MQAPLLAQHAAALSRGVPCGMLAWWGRTDFPDGTPSAPRLAQADWEAWYARLQQAALVPDRFVALDAVKAMTVPLRPDGPLPVAIADFRVATLDPAAPEQRAFIACGLLHGQWGTATPTYRSRTVTFSFDARFYFSNPGAPLPDSFDFDPGDGHGFRSVRLGEQLSVTYGNTDTVHATLRCGGARSSFDLLLGSQPAAPVADDTWQLQAANGCLGSAYVYRATGQTVLTRPMIIAEGFPGGYPCDYLYEMLNQHGTLEALRNAGYDIILLGFANGTDLLQNNAQVMQACIRQAMQQTPAPLVVGGVSMGGLVARYALTEMEARGQAHNTRIFLTLDTPHRGAYTNLCNQWFAHYFASAAPLAKSFSALLDSPANQQFVMAWFNGHRVQVSPLREQFTRALAALGNYPQQPRRLAIACGTGDGQRTQGAHAPALDWAGSPLAHARLWTLTEGDDNPGVIAEGCSLLADGSVANTLSCTSEWSWEGAPGGQNLYNYYSAMIAQAIGYGTVTTPIAQTCAVPTVSALDLPGSPFEAVPPPASGRSPFDDYICCETNQLHLQFTPRIKDWLLDQLTR